MHTAKRCGSALCLPVAIGLCTGFAAPAFAFTFEAGEVEGQFDSSLSVGASWALQEPDTHLIGRANGGKGFSSGGDNGRQNFEQGKTFSKIFKGLHELELKYQDTGVFVRGKYWYDFELQDEDREFVPISDDNRKEGSKSAGAQLLDAFVYHNYVIGDAVGSIRVGKQVVNWGEGTFILGGINSINPVDASAFYRPGAEIKEGLLPVNMIYLSQNLTENVSAEAFYQLDWEQTQLSNCGTFFSPVDFIADGCRGLPTGPNLTGNPLAVAALTPFGINLSKEGVVVPRADDDDARNSGQWGTALRWYVPSVSTEFGAYFMNYHSRQPYVNTIAGPNVNDRNFVPQLCNNIGIGNPAVCAGLLGPNLDVLTQLYRVGTAHYQVTYPEDIRLYGLSFATTLPIGTALSGEISYRPNMPIQLNALDQTNAVLGDAAVMPGVYSAQNNGLAQGYVRKPFTQVQVSATQLFEDIAGANHLTVIGEVGAVHVGNLEGQGSYRYGRSPIFGSGQLYPDNQACRSYNGVNAARYCNEDGFVTPWAWGYRLRAMLEYSDLIPSVTLKPNVAWSHDVSGFSPEPGFNEGNKAISVGIDAEYQNTYTASLSATNFFDGTYNTNVDRDFVSLSFGVAF